MNRTLRWIEKVACGCRENQKEKKFFLEYKQKYSLFSKTEKKNLLLEIKRAYGKDAVVCLVSWLLLNIEINELLEDFVYFICMEHFDCYAGSMLEMQIRSKLNCSYDLLKMLHEKNAERFQEELNRNYSAVPVNQRKKNRVVIATEQIKLPKYHAPSRCVFEIAYTLQKHLGYEVLILECPSDYPLPESLWYGSRTGFCSGIQNDEERLIFSYKDVSFDIYRVFMKDKNRNSYNKMTAFVHRWKPFFVFSIGVLNPMVDLFGNMTTLAAMGLTSGYPISGGQILIRLGMHDSDKEIEYKKHLNENQTQIFLSETMPHLKEESSHSYNRQEEGLPEDKFLIAVVGNRLDLEIDEQFLHVMNTIADKLPKAAFCVIGEVDKLKKMLAGNAIEKQIYYMGYRKDLIGTYDLMDLYLNPKRVGGGFSGITALQAGIPVITLPDCDVARQVGENYIVSNYEEMIETTVRYAKDSSFYKQKIEEFQDEGNTEHAMIQYVGHLMDEISAQIEKEA
ncbi:MAG: glycosyltransferase family 4 protein [Clostridiaceae bacterium]|nr:glycosyltransferase family 4 protein [Clostridiaceae bacterium]